MTHFTAFQKPYEHNTLLSFDNIVLSNHGVCVYEQLTRSKRGVLLPRAMPLKYAFRRYLRRFGTAENILKTMSLKHEFWPLMVVETDWNCRRNENNVSKAYILTVFETIWNCRNKWEQGWWSVHCDGIWNDLELHRFFLKQGRYIVHSDGI